MDQTNPIIQAFEAAANGQATSTPLPVETSAETQTPKVEAAQAPDIDFDKLIGEVLPTPKKAAETAVSDDQKSSESASVDDRFPDADAIEDLTPKARAKWGELRSELKTYESKAKELEAKLAEYETKVASAQNTSVDKALEERVKEYETKLQSYEKEIAVAKVEASEPYKRLVEEPSKAILSAVEAMAKEHEIDESALIDALFEDNAKKKNTMLSELIEGMSERERSRIWRFADEMDGILAKADELRENAATAYEELQALQKEEAEKAAREHKVTMRNAASEVLTMFEAKKLNDFGIDITSKKDQILEHADITSLPPKAQAYLAVSGTVLPDLLKALSDKAARIKELETSVSALTKATPGAGFGSSSTTTASSSKNEVAAFLFGQP